MVNHPAPLCYINTLDIYISVSLSGWFQPVRGGGVAVQTLQGGHALAVRRLLLLRHHRAHHHRWGWGCRGWADCVLQVTATPRPRPCTGGSSPWSTRCSGYLWAWCFSTPLVGNQTSNILHATYFILGERLNRFSSMIIDKIRRVVNAKQKETTEVGIYRH